MKKLSTAIICLLLVACIVLPLCACQAEHECASKCPRCEKCTNASCTEISCKEKCTCKPVLHDSWSILTGKTHVGESAETTVHVFDSQAEGPNIAIVGGTHGDEVAGWTAGLQLLDLIPQLKGFCGKILLIPQANIVADNHKVRYAGSSDKSNLNRVYPSGRIDGADEEVVAIADAIVKTVEDFQPDYVIDLHESRGSWTGAGASKNSTLGDTLIFDNEGLFMDELLTRYNTVYRQAGEPEFMSEPANKAGSFSKYFSEKYPNNVVFTIETNRDYNPTTKLDQIALDTRVRQQLNILNTLFDLAWNRI